MNPEVTLEKFTNVCRNPAVKRVGGSIGFTALLLLSIFSGYVADNLLQPQGSVLAQNNSPQGSKMGESIATPEEEKVLFPPHIIGIRHEADGDKLYNTKTGEYFIPRGFNLIPLDNIPGQHAMFDETHFDAEKFDKDLDLMKLYGYNTVRVFLNESFIGDEMGGLSKTYVENISTFLKLTKKHNIYVDLTLNKIPFQGGYVPKSVDPKFEYDNGLLFTKEGVEARARFMRDLLVELRKLNAPTEFIAIISPENEWVAWEDKLPLSLNSGMFRAANNVVYDMGSALDKKRMIEDSLIYAVNYLKLNALLPIDPTALLGTGLYPNHVVEHPSDKRIIFTEKFLADINGSLSDVHLPRHYEGTGVDPLQEAYWYLENKHSSFQQITKKPIIWEEEGFFTYPWGNKNGITNNEYAALLLNRVQARSCNIRDYSGQTVMKVSGWLTWSLGMPKFAEPIVGTMIVENEDPVYRYRSPKYRPNPCLEDPIPGIPKLKVPNMEFLPVAIR